MFNVKNKKPKSNKFIKLFMQSFKKINKKPQPEPLTLEALFRNYKGSYKPILEFDDPAIGDEFGL
jgi:DNA/RNA-binding domain of Phe-tRNA-synthetase-like protein